MVLRGADRSFPIVVRLALYTADVETLLQNFDINGARLGAAKAMPAHTMVGVGRLFLPQLIVAAAAAAAAAAAR